ncbi:MAG: prepilin-type N-terminal cleavage/methylation domain-containing protein [Gemmatimonadetes bacterium]|nr:prepilin-type N-terminal cleavage/methylation domain-containing protein [Gemmatimonadota bacterium]
MTNALYGMVRGFTLIEVLTVVVIIGILAAVGTPRVVKTLDRLAVGRAMNETIAFYRTARLAAVLSGRRVRIEFSPDDLRAVFEGSSDSTFLVVSGPATYGVSLRVSRPVIRLQATGLGLGGANTKLVLRRGAAADSLATSRLGRIRRIR